MSALPCLPVAPSSLIPLPTPSRLSHCPQCNTFLGTVTYMSPERLAGEPYSFSADIWALGLALLECATGKYPYDASGGAIQLMMQVGGGSAVVVLTWGPARSAGGERRACGCCSGGSQHAPS